MPIRKVVIPVAGFGTRMLPATKSIPKEMLPVGGKPVIHHLIEEAAESGITEVILVNHPSPYKKSIENYFKPFPELEKRLEEAGKDDLLDMIRSINQMANISVVYQEKPLGNGHAILMAADLLGDEPFAVIWGDELVESDESDIPRLRQLIDTFNEHQGSVLALAEAKHAVSFPEYCKRYGCVGGEIINEKVQRIHSIIEKPDPSQAPSRFFSVGGYIYTPRIIEILKETKPGKSGEIWLADATDQLLKEEKIYGRVLAGNYWDVGNYMGFLKANIHYALKEDVDKTGELHHFLENEV